MAVVAVFDTNLLFSGLLWRGNPYRCLELMKSRTVESVTCQEILNKLAEKLRVKRNFSDTEVMSAQFQVRLFSRIVTVPHQLKGISTDPDDDIIIECAVVGNASHIVTGDKRHLLPLGSYQGIQIVTAADFLAHVARS